MTAGEPGPRAGAPVGDEPDDDPGAGPRVLFLLRHSPGPALAPGQQVFEHPGIQEHYAFLQRRMADGSLVAAGPLASGSGEGLTILDVPSLGEARELAQRDDASVTMGVLSVEVSSWQVVMDPGLRQG